MANDYYKQASETRDTKMDKLGAKGESGKAKRIAGTTSSSDVTELPPITGS